MSDRRVQVLVNAAMEDLQAHADAMRAKGWPVAIRADNSDDGTEVTISLVVTVVPVHLEAKKATV